MSYISLYRKYRPQKFSDVVGQEVVVKILKNSIVNNKIGHAYIFSGPRGTGKTSIAKIFSKAVNCLSTKDGDLCEKCDICKLNIDDETDIIEIDAASNNGVDEIREIRNNVKLLPAHLKYKVYIIDEVHMLSISAFNALLKTLEEPPKNVIFILATTEFNKIPATVVSRCQKFDFKKLTSNQIKDRLNYILKCENKYLNEDVISLISTICDGGMRDAINMLDQLLSIEKDNITIDDVYNIIGDIKEQEIFDFLKLITSSKIKELLDKIDQFYNSGKNFINICDRLQLLIRNIIIYNNTSNYFEEKYEKELQSFSKIDINLLLKLSDEIFKLILDLKKSSNQKIVMEIYVLKMTLMFKEKTIIKEEKVVTVENKNDDKNNENYIDNKNIKINNALSTANKEIKKEFLEKFSIIKEYVSSKDYNSIANLLLKSTPEVVSNTNILFTFKNNFEVILFEKNEIEIINFLKKIFNKKYSIVSITYNEWEKIKNKYIEDIKNGIKYEYKEEKKEIKSNLKKTELESTVENLFGDDIIKVN